MCLWAHVYHSTPIETRDQISTLGSHRSTLLRQGLLCYINHMLAGEMERCLGDKKASAATITEDLGLVPSTYILSLTVTPVLDDHFWSLGAPACM